MYYRKVYTPTLINIYAFTTTCLRHALEGEEAGGCDAKGGTEPLHPARLSLRWGLLHHSEVGSPSPSPSGTSGFL